MSESFEALSIVDGLDDSLGYFEATCEECGQGHIVAHGSHQDLYPCCGACGSSDLICTDDDV